MKKRIVLEENDIIKMIAEKYGIDKKEIKTEINEYKNDYGVFEQEINFVFDEKEEIDTSSDDEGENDWRDE